VARPAAPPPALSDTVVPAVPAGRPPAPARTTARPTLPGPAGPALAVVIDDVGPDAAAARALVALDGPLTIAFLPYAEGLPPLVDAARARGHEVFVHLPMAPEGPADPGPNALVTGLAEAELRARTRWAIGRVPAATGVNNHMGSRLTADAAAMAPVMDEIARAGLVFLDSRTSPRSVAEQIARARGLAATSRDVFLDNIAEPAAIVAALDEAERIARARGSAVAIGHPYPATLAALRAWLPGARARGLRLVRTSELVRLREACGATGCAALARGA
jgi:hypothetical protein